MNAYAQSGINVRDVECCIAGSARCITCIGNGSRVAEAGTALLDAVLVDADTDSVVPTVDIYGLRRAGKGCYCLKPGPAGLDAVFGDVLPSYWFSYRLAWLLPS